MSGIGALEGHSDWVGCAVHSPKDDLLASDSHDNVRLWDVETGASRHVLRGANCEYRVLINDMVASGAEDGGLKSWDVDSGSCFHTMSGHNCLIEDVVFRQKRILSSLSDMTKRYAYGVPEPRPLGTQRMATAD